MATALSLIRRRLVLETIRQGSHNQRLRCFPLSQAALSGEQPQTPADFHSLLCHKIRTAQERVQLASLYIGTDVDSVQEQELWDALHQTSARGVSTQIVLDAHRATRQSNTTSSAHQLAQKTLQHVNSSLYLLSVLSPLYQKLPHPLNEAAGVFHIKAYVIDDCVILSGANLSHEYFTTRMDRYVCLHETKLVDWYSHLVQQLCQLGSNQRTSDDRGALQDLFLTSADDDDGWKANDPDEPWTDGKPVAYAVPTFVSPKHLQLRNVRSDPDVLHDVLTHHPSLHARFATAYLNPPPSLMQSLQHSTTVHHFLTASAVSHGFAPNPLQSKQRPWIPTVFDYISRTVPTNVSYYHRPGWTFHAKGLWLSCSEDNQELHLMPSSDLVAVTVGSGNFGYRSFYRDMESNLILVLPPQSPLQGRFRQEWNDLCAYAVDQDETKAIPKWVAPAFPFMKTFF